MYAGFQQHLAFVQNLPEIDHIISNRITQRSRKKTRRSPKTNFKMNSIQLDKYEQIYINNVNNVNSLVEFDKFYTKSAIGVLR